MTDVLIALITEGEKSKQRNKGEIKNERKEGEIKNERKEGETTEF